MAHILVHHLEFSRSTRILWMLEELGVDYDMKTWKRKKNLRAPEGLRDVHPLGRAPIVVIGDDILAESAAILDSLVDRYGAGRFRPDTGPDLDDYRYWMHYAESSMMPPMIVKLVIGKVRQAPMPFFIKPIAKAIANKVDANYSDPEIASHFTFVNGHLADKPFMVSDTLTAADVQIAYPLLAMKATSGMTEYPHIATYLDRIEARPAYRRAVVKGGPVRPPSGRR
jgi:glutathione S-transferase